MLFKGDQPVGFLLAYLDISAAIKRTGDKLWPFGWITLVQGFRKTEWINVNGAGILPEYRGMGGTALLFDEMPVSIREGQYQHADLVQIGIENEKIRREIESSGINFYKTHSIFRQKIL